MNWGCPLFVNWMALKNCFSDILWCSTFSYPFDTTIWLAIHNTGVTMRVWQYGDEKILMWFQFYTQCDCISKGGNNSNSNSFYIQKMGVTVRFTFTYTPYVCMYDGSVVKFIARWHALLVPVQYNVILHTVCMYKGEAWLNPRATCTRSISTPKISSLPPSSSVFSSKYKFILYTVYSIHAYLSLQQSCQ